MNNFAKQSSTMTKLQFVGPVQWLWEIQFLDKKTQSPWKLTELRKVRKEKARASRALFPLLQPFALPIAHHQLHQPSRMAIQLRDLPRPTSLSLALEVGSQIVAAASQRYGSKLQSPMLSVCPEGLRYHLYFSLKPKPHDSNCHHVSYMTQTALFGFQTCWSSFLLANLGLECCYKSRYPTLGM